VRQLYGILLLIAVWIATAADPGPFRFVILGDRTGETVPGVYEQVWRETVAENPAFVLTVGDSIQGLHDDDAPAEWQQVEQILQPYRRFPIYLAAGNHDIWSSASEQLFLKHTGRAVHFSFDSGPVHCTVLDNSRSDELSSSELAYLEADLKVHAERPVKFIVSHRPSWLLDVAMQNPESAVQRLARQYGVQYVIAGHLHQMLHLSLQGVTYISMPSAGGHLRNSEKYEDGWFFGHVLVQVQGSETQFQIEEAKPPHGQGRKTTLDGWGMTGLISKHTK
jgi:Icc protein